MTFRDRYKPLFSRRQFNLTPYRKTFRQQLPQMKSPPFTRRCGARPPLGASFQVTKPQNFRSSRSLGLARPWQPYKQRIKQQQQQRRQQWNWQQDIQQSRNPAFHIGSGNERTTGLWIKRQPWCWTSYTQQRQNQHQQQRLHQVPTSTPMTNPWVNNTLVRKRNWRLKERCEVGTKRSRGMQTEAVENVLYSQRVTTNPRKAEAPRRRGLLPAGQGTADSWASESRNQRSLGRPRSKWPLRRNRVQAIAEWHFGNPRQNVLYSQRVSTNPRKAEAPRRRGLLPAGQGIADSWASVVRGNLNQRSLGRPRSEWPLRRNSVHAMDDAEWRLANPRRQRIPRRRWNVPDENSVNGRANYWDVLQPWRGRFLG